MTTKSTEKMAIVLAEDRFQDLFKNSLKQWSKEIKFIFKTDNIEQINRKFFDYLLVLWNSENINSGWASWLRNVKCMKRHLFLSRGPFSREAVNFIIELSKERNTKVHILPVEENQQPQKVLDRLGHALANPAGSETILDAWWENKTLVVMSSKFETLKIPLEELLCLRGKTPEETMNFQVDVDGYYIYWPELDVHLGWEQFLQITNPEALLRAQQKSREFNKRYGQAIRKLREKKKLKQSDIEGLDARQVRRIEKGECRVTYSAMDGPRCRCGLFVNHPAGGAWVL